MQFFAVTLLESLKMLNFVQSVDIYAFIFNSQGLILQPKVA